jgi:hypothetical protein
MFRGNVSFVGALPVFAALTLAAQIAPVGAAPQAFANINDLASDYSGKVFSNRDDEIQDVDVSLDVTQRNGNRFTGTLSVSPPDIALVGSCTGSVSRSGKVSVSAVYTPPDSRLKLTLKGQLSATGKAIIGTYIVTGRDDVGPVRDNGTFYLEREP